MNAMQLPHPKKIDIALPANLVSGKPVEGTQPVIPDWAPVVITYAGVPEVTPEWAARHPTDVTVLDVRDLNEIEAGSSNIAAVQIIPLSELRERLSEIQRDKPVVTFCRSGRRSAMAVEILQQADFSSVASMAGGYLRWHEEGFDLVNH
jgi:sulfur dioxygenase